MSPYAYAGAFLAVVSLACYVPSWLDRRRTARRYDAASLAFWTSLTAYVDRAHADIDNRIEQALLEGEARAGSATSDDDEWPQSVCPCALDEPANAEVTRRIRAHMDAAVAELSAELETPQNWSA